MKNQLNYLILILGILFSTSVLAETSEEMVSKDTVELGIWVEDVFNINFSERTYEVVFWLWANSNSDTFDLEKYTDFNNSTEASFALKYSTKLKDGRFHSESKVKVKFLNKYDISRFPFDRQKLNFNIEFIKDAFNDCIMIIDTNNSNFDPELSADFHKKPNFDVNYKFGEKRYETNWGNTDLGKNSSWYRLDAVIELERDSWSIAYKLFITLFISLLLASSSILLPLEMSEEKFALIVGSLFTAIGNKYISDSVLPVSGGFNLSDTLHLITFIFITIMSLNAVIEQRYKIDRNRKIDLWIFVSVLIIYVIIIFLTISFL